MESIEWSGVWLLGLGLGTSLEAVLSASQCFVSRCLSLACFAAESVWLTDSKDLSCLFLFLNWGNEYVYILVDSQVQRVLAYSTAR